MAGHPYSAKWARDLQQGDVFRVEHRPGVFTEYRALRVSSDAQGVTALLRQPTRVHVIAADESGNERHLDYEPHHAVWVLRGVTGQDIDED